MDAKRAEITLLLQAWGSGDSSALDRLAEQVYPELRQMARRHMRNERSGNTLQTTALVHEVYLRLVDVTQVEWRQRAQFFAMAAEMMRRILVSAARARGAQPSETMAAVQDRGQFHGGETSTINRGQTQVHDFRTFEASRQNLSPRSVDSDDLRHQSSRRLLAQVNPQLSRCRLPDLDQYRIGDSRQRRRMRQNCDTICNSVSIGSVEKASSAKSRR